MLVCSVFYYYRPYPAIVVCNPALRLPYINKSIVYSGICFISSMVMEGYNYVGVSLRVCHFVCPSVWGASPLKLLNGFG